MAVPLVTVVCLCYNQERFVREAIQSVMQQTYANIEFMIVDDASTDNSVQIISDFLRTHPQIKFFPLSRNVGNCRAFNSALAHAKGEFVIDLAADDALLPERIARGVRALDSAGNEYGVNFTDALWINELGERLQQHSDRFPHNEVPKDDIYREVITKFFICSPTMMFRTEVIRSMGGYDESLRYEDFDFIVRSARDWKYCYTPEVLVKKRVVRGSMSQKQFSFFSSQQSSTLRICEKILALNRTSEEQSALSERILYEMRVCLKLLHFPLVWKYAQLLLKNSRMRYH